MAKVVRNPNRGSGKEHRPTSPFVPEWQRIGVEPAVYENVQRDFQMLPKQKRPKVATHSQQPQQLNVPKQTRVGSMSSDEVSFSREFSRETTAKTKKPIAYDDIPLPPPSIHSKQGIPAPKVIEQDDEYEDDEEDELEEDEVELEEDEEDDDQSETSNYLRFKPGQYALLVRGEIILIGDNREKMEKTIESIVYNGLNGEEVELSELMLIRCIPLKMGVIAME